MLAGKDAERLESLQQDIKFINNLLSQCGLEAPFPFARIVADPTGCSGSDLYNLEGAVRILIALLNSKQKENAFRAELEERQRRLNEELDSREILINKYHGKLEASEKELRGVQQQVREALARIQQLEGVAQTSTEEANRLRSAFAVKEKHFNNELRKRERDFEKLRDQLQSCLREPAAIVSSQTRSENAFDTTVMRQSLRSTAAAVNSSSEEDEFDGVRATQGMRDAEEDSPQTARIDLLEHENANMRQLLSSLSQILGEMRRTAQLNAGVAAEDLEEAAEITGQISSLPISWIYDKVKDDIEASLATLSEFLRSP